MMDTAKACDICGGSGEVSFFKGVSRFVLSNEVCPACNGAGWVDLENKESTEGENNACQGEPDDD